MRYAVNPANGQIAGPRKAGSSNLVEVAGNPPVQANLALLAGAD